MRDCPNVEMRERLPELLAGVLRADVAAAVHAHVAQCDDCRAELALLEQVRTVLTPPRVDTSRVVAALPPYRRPSIWTRATRSPQLRAAAAIVLLIGGFAVVRRSTVTDPIPDTAVAVTTVATELSIGDTFQDLSDDDLTAMIDEIARLEPVTPDAADDEMPSLTTTPVRAGGGA